MVGDVFVVDQPYRMFSGVEEAAKIVYHRQTDRKGRVWLWPVNSVSPAEQIHVHDPKDTHSDGYGGSTLTFALEDGTEYKAKGPWHSNSYSLFAATGVDLRDTNWTYGCVAKKRVVLSHKNGNAPHDQYEGVLYADKEPVLGVFDRLQKIAVEWADKLGHPVACYSSSKGGSSSGYELPSGTEWAQWRDWFKEQR